MKHKGFEGDYQFDDDDMTFHGEVVDISDVITFQADTVEDLEKEFKTAIDRYISMLGE